MVASALAKGLIPDLKRNSVTSFVPQGFLAFFIRNRGFTGYVLKTTRSACGSRLVTL